MQLNKDGTRYAASPANTGNTAWEVTLIEPSKDRFFVDMWTPEGDNHWNHYFNDLDKALAIYNKWALHKEAI